ncbi:NAD-glutamate dehydrogenase domain-containing protein [Desulfoplanes formicivorans]|uniref:Amino acid dehydrogenase n=1 Tax=Desulfoplanes formicivorans TaxID=1592317 RepID=A0A194AFQ5_9BACT|nr:NAD-glutamate dehydrogenase domain-containing protein [Desulfoplanes formicivorans]GAU08912.1 amino acid dehydrogenase [Desulfoplanes formicivorans]
MPDSVHTSVTQSTLETLKQTMAHEADQITPWFYANMHPYYFKSHTREEVLTHLHGIVSGQVTTMNRTLTLRSPCKTRVTYINPGTATKDMVDILEGLKGTNLQTARIYTSADKAITLCTFHQAPQKLADPDDPSMHKALAKLKELSLVPASEEDSFSSFLTCASLDYIEKFDPQRAARHYEIIRQIRGTERVHVTMEPLPNNQDRITIAMTEPMQDGMLLEVIKILNRADVRIHRAYADLFDLGQEGNVGIVSLYVSCANGEPASTGHCSAILKQELAWIKWLQPGDLERFADDHGCTLAQVALIQASCLFVHQFLHRKDKYAYTLNRIRQTVLKHPEATRALVDYFEARFDPQETRRNDRVQTARASATQILDTIPQDLEQSILQCILQFMDHVLKTNYYVTNRFGLGFRLDPAMLKDLFEGELPYGIFFFIGPRFHGFHVRYRDMARGGVRVVRTRNKEHFELENARLFDEATALASSQQLKNKDIPEGGSKAVLLLAPNGSVDLAVKSMTNTLLDMIISTRELTSPDNVVDYLGHHEIIYLGPDENILPRHIDWIVERAEKRGYPWARAFMSSKPGAGINHKEYGVTSLGVIVFMEEILKTLGIDPSKDVFRVKMTGGPAGDVAGNCLRILLAKYPETVRIVAMTDGHGAIFDPEGLDHEELKRLLDQGERCNAFSPHKLHSPEGLVVDASTPEGAKIRNNLHNTAQAEVFIPAGGRPDTINAKNWGQFLLPDGTPSAKAIVEGANIFISREARDHLQEAGVIFLHGSSANKTGVICSSYEVLAGLILSADEFLAIKKEYIAQVLTILEHRARSEARMLTREFRYSGGKTPMTEISFAASREINELGDMISDILAEHVSDLHGDPDLCELILDYCPPVLVAKYRDRIISDIPVRHQFALLGAVFASSMVYREGLGWLKRISKLRNILDVIHADLQERKHLRRIEKIIASSNLDDRETILNIVRSRGQRYLTTTRLGLEN